MALLGFEPKPFFGPVLSKQFFDVCATDSLALVPKEAYWVVHQFSGEKARQLDDAIWSHLLHTFLSEERFKRIVIVGSSREMSKVIDTLAAQFPGRVLDRIGKTGLQELFLLCQSAEGGLTVDSFVAHAILAAGKPVIVVDKLGLGTRMSFPSTGVFYLDARDPNPKELGEQLKIALQTGSYRASPT